MAHRQAVGELGKKRREVRGVAILNAHAVDHPSHLWRFFRTSGIRKGESGFRTSETIRTLTGSDPQRLEQFFAANAEVFGGVRKVA